jgi:DMSO reductase anchor subunit
LALGAATLGLLGVFCSAMIYVDTRRPFWNARLTLPKFFGTALLLGATAGGAVLACMGSAVAPSFAVAATAIRTLLFAWESRCLVTSLCDDGCATHRSAVVTVRLMRWLPFTRAVLFVISTVASVAAIASASGPAALWAVVALASTLTSQLLERYHYFRAVVAPRMPGSAA